MNATGWCAFTFPGHSESDRLATYLYEAAEKRRFAPALSAGHL